MRVLVCGGRNYRDRRRVFEMLDVLPLVDDVTEVIHGAAAGADTLAGEWARSRRIKETPVPADWKNEGRGAGPRRNARMLAMRPDLVVAFPGGNGTAHMVSISTRADVPVWNL